MANQGGPGAATPVRRGWAAGVSGFYILDVPEFGPLARVAGQNPRCVLHPAIGGYRYVQFSGAIDIRRQDTGLNEAVWFGCLTGGLDGKINTFEGRHPARGDERTGLNHHVTAGR